MVELKLLRFQTGWSGCIYLFIYLFSFVSVAHLNVRVSFCTFGNTEPYRSSGQMSCREEAVSILLRSAHQNRKQHATNFDQPKSHANSKTQWEDYDSEVPFLKLSPRSFAGTRDVEDCRPSK
jgi:hypothetical protein